MTQNPERYSPEEAAEEASQMQKKVKSGEARSYDQAELIVEREKSKLSVGGIRAYTQELKTKIEDQKRERARHIEGKILDREELIKEAQTTVTLLGEAKEAFDYYTTMRDLEELKDPQDVARLKELKKLVSSLEIQLQDIEGRIERITNRPEIFEKLQDRAAAEDLERKLKDMFEKGKAELLPQIKQVFEKIKRLAVSCEFLSKKEESNESELMAAQRGLNKVFDPVENELRKHGKGELLAGLDEAKRNNPRASALYKRIVVMRLELGWFMGKEKAALDRLIAAKGKFDTLDEQQKEVANIQDRFKRFKSDRTEVAQQYRDIILKGWDIDEKLQELREKEPLVTQQLSLVYSLSHELEKLVDAFALQKLRGDSGRVVEEKYSNNNYLKRARDHPDNKFLDLTFWSVYREAGGQKLHYVSPKKSG